MKIRLAEWKIRQSFCLIGISEFLARVHAYIKFFTLATVATLQINLIYNEGRHPLQNIL